MTVKHDRHRLGCDTEGHVQDALGRLAGEGGTFEGVCFTEKATEQPGMAARRGDDVEHG